MADIAILQAADGWDVAAAVLIIAGTALSAVAGIGLLRFPDLLSRMHAATKPQVLGLLLVLIGLACVWRAWVWLPILVVAWVLQLITAPVSAHLVGRAAYRTKHLKPEYLYTDELFDVVVSQEETDVTTAPKPPRAERPHPRPAKPDKPAKPAK